MDRGEVSEFSPYLGMTPADLLKTRAKLKEGFRMIRFFWRSRSA